MEIVLRVNGREVGIDVRPNELLIDVIRDRLGLKSVKRSCDVQVCGTCTVLLDGLPISSCATLAYEARNRELTTLEGMSSDVSLHPIQETFLRFTGFQCGYCTPGMILTAKSLLDANPDPTEAEIREYMSGNLCRCTGYWHILEAIRAARSDPRRG